MNTMVSIVCVAYNHSKYIKQAIDSFLAQKTKYSFEIVIHDDCSNDGTTEIIKRFEEKNPNTVKAIYEKENQYSKGNRILLDIVVPKCSGKYIAYCEGDDYWTDPYKIEKQISYMESHPQCTLCIHSASIVDLNGREFNIISPYNNNCVVDCASVIQGGGGFVATNSIVAPMRLVRKAPKYLYLCCMDWVLQMYFASQGTTFYFSDKMSAYRKGVSVSWSEKTSKDIKYYISLRNKYIKVRSMFNKETNGRYQSILDRLNADDEILKYIYYSVPKKKWSQRARNAWNNMSKSVRLRKYTMIKYPQLFKRVSTSKMKTNVLRHAFSELKVKKNERY